MMATKQYSIEDEFDALLDSLTVSLQSTNVRKPVRETAAEPLKAPPTVSVKPTRKKQAATGPLKVPPPVSAKPVNKKVRIVSTTLASKPSDDPRTVAKVSSQPLNVSPAVSQPLKVSPAVSQPMKVSPAVSQKPSQNLNLASIARFANDSATEPPKPPRTVSAKPFKKTHTSSFDYVADPSDDKSSAQPEKVAATWSQPAELIPSIVDPFLYDLPPPPAEMLEDNSNVIADKLKDLPTTAVPSKPNVNDAEFFGVCAKCGENIPRKGSGCTAVCGKMYHKNCFVCEDCGAKLTGLVFYNLNEAPHCEQCYTKTLEDCYICKEKVKERILSAVGNSYHPECFACVSCDKNLDGIPFTLDPSNTVLCVECHELKFSPKCATCDKLITATNDRGETVHMVSMGKNYHLECYKCEDCEILLSSEQGRACYPIDGHLLCQQCSSIRRQNGSK